MNKKMLSKLLAVIMIASTANMQIGATSLNGVSQTKNLSTWAYKEVTTYLGGNYDESANYKFPISRQEVAQAIYDVMERNGFDWSTVSPASLTDTSDRACTYIAGAGILPASNGSFSPTAKVTREQLAYILVKACETVGTPVQTSAVNFKDSNKIGSNFMNYVQQALGTGLVKGEGANYKPKDYITREQMYCTLYRTQDKYVTAINNGTLLKAETNINARNNLKIDANNTTNTNTTTGNNATTNDKNAYTYDANTGTLTVTGTVTFDGDNTTTGNIRTYNTVILKKGANATFRKVTISTLEATEATVTLTDTTVTNADLENSKLFGDDGSKITRLKSSGELSVKAEDTKIKTVELKSYKVSSSSKSGSSRFNYDDDDKDRDRDDDRDSSKNKSTVKITADSRLYDVDICADVDSLISDGAYNMELDGKFGNIDLNKDGTVLFMYAEASDLNVASDSDIDCFNYSKITNILLDGDARLSTDKRAKITKIKSTANAKNSKLEINCDTAFENKTSMTINGVKVTSGDKIKYQDGDLYINDIKREKEESDDTEVADEVLKYIENESTVLKFNTSVDDITSNLYFPTARKSATITWESNNKSVISNTGEYKAPKTDTIVIVKATIKAGTAIRTTTYNFTAKASADTQTTDYLDKTLNSLSIPRSVSGYEGTIINMPTNVNGCSVSWSSSNPSVINTQGLVTPQDNQVDITLVATASAYGTAKSKEFVVTVGARGKNPNVTSELDSLTMISVADLQVTELALAQVSSKGNPITWTSSSPSVISNAGKITHQITDTEVVMTAKTGSDTKSFTIKVIGTNSSSNSLSGLTIPTEVSTSDSSIKLPDNYDNRILTWTSSNPSVISNSGVIGSVSNVTEVNLTATNTLGETKTFTVTVTPAINTTDLDSLISKLTVPTEVDTTTTLDLTKQSITDSDVTVSWSSSDNEIINPSTGEVTFSYKSNTVTLTATLTKADKSVTKDFTVKVDKVNDMNFTVENDNSSSYVLSFKLKSPYNFYGAIAQIKDASTGELLQSSTISDKGSHSKSNGYYAINYSGSIPSGHPSVEFVVKSDDDAILFDKTFGSTPTVDLSSLSIPTSVNANDGTISLPNKLGSKNIVWISNNTSIISNTGVITPPDTTTIVRLTAVVDGQTKDFDVTVNVPVATYDFTETSMTEGSLIATVESNVDFGTVTFELYDTENPSTPIYTTSVSAGRDGSTYKATVRQSISTTATNYEVCIKNGSTTLASKTFTGTGSVVAPDTSAVSSSLSVYSLRSNDVAYADDPNNMEVIIPETQTNETDDQETQAPDALVDIATPQNPLSEEDDDTMDGDLVE